MLKTKTFWFVIYLSLIFFTVLGIVSSVVWIFLCKCNSQLTLAQASKGTALSSFILVVILLILALSAKTKST